MNIIEVAKQSGRGTFIRLRYFISASVGAFPEDQILQYARLDIQPVQQCADVNYDGPVCRLESCLGVYR